MSNRSKRAEQIVVQQAASNGLGTAGCIISIIGFFTCGLLSPIGLLLAFFGLFKAPRGAAIAGTILGAIGSWWLIVFGLAMIASLAGMGDAASEALNNVPTAQYAGRAGSSSTTGASSQRGLANGGHGRITHAAADEKVLTYVKILSLNGAGHKNSDTFELSGKGAKLAYAFRDTSGFGASVMQVYMHPTAGVLKMPQVLVNESGGKPTSDTTAIHAGAGTYYLEVNAANCNWTLDIYDMREVSAKDVTGDHGDAAAPPSESVEHAEPSKSDTSPNMRTWKSANGKYTVQAEFLGFKNGKVKLRKADGKEIDVSPLDLSKDDVRWYRAELKRRQAKEEAAKKRARREKSKRAR